MSRPCVFRNRVCHLPVLQYQRYWTEIVLLYAESHGYMDGNIFIAYNTFAYCDVDFIHKDSGIIKIHFGKKKRNSSPPHLHTCPAPRVFSLNKSERDFIPDHHSYVHKYR